MMKVLVPLLAAVTLVAVGFVLVELHAPTTPPPVSPSPPPPPPPIPPASAPLPTPAAQPVAPSPSPPSDPLDVVVRGKTRRQWHAFFAERQQQLTADIQRYQAIVDRAIAGEEPDPRELSEAHVKIRELNARLKDDLEDLQQIDGTP